MSAKYTFLAWDTPIDSAPLKLALLQLANNADDNGFSFYSISKMALACGMSERTFQRKIVEMEEKGILTVERRSNRPSLYNLIGDEMGVTLCHLQSSGVTESHAGVTDCRAGVTESDRGGDRESLVPNSTPNTSPKSNPNTLSPTVKKSKFCPVHFASYEYQGFELNLESWTEWCEFRKDNKKPIIKTTATKQLKMLVNHSADEQKEIIDKSIIGQYQGLFPPKNQTQPRYASKQSVAIDNNNTDWMNTQSFSDTLEDL